MTASELASRKPTVLIVTLCPQITELCASFSPYFGDVYGKQNPIAVLEIHRRHSSEAEREISNEIAICSARHRHFMMVEAREAIAGYESKEDIVLCRRLFAR